MNRSLVLLTLTAALASTGCVGLSAGSAYPDYDSDETRKHLLSPHNAKDPSISLGDIFAGAAPFALMMLVVLALVLAFPTLATALL